jgi:hypothetical protein
MRRNRSSGAHSYLLEVATNARNAARSGCSKDDCPYSDYEEPRSFTTRFNYVRAARHRWIASFEAESAKMAAEELDQEVPDV